jgi:hypothetical protein
MLVESPLLGAEDALLGAEDTGRYGAIDTNTIIPSPGMTNGNS